MVDFSTVELTEDQKKFRDEVRAFLDEHLTDAVQARRHAAQVNYDEEFYLAMGAKGCLEPRWSKEEGGAGFDDLQARILATELRRRDAPIGPIGLTNLVWPGRGGPPAPRRL